MNPMHILIVGGVAAGASFAARARRLNESARITLLERGNDVSFANCGLPYFIGGDITDRHALTVQTPASLKALLNVEVRPGCEAIRIDRENRHLHVKNRQTGETVWLSYDKLMLSPGARPRRLSVPGAEDERVFTLRDLADMDRIAAAVRPGRRALVVGAGFIGLEMAEQLRRQGLAVDVVQKGPRILPQIGAPLSRLLEIELVSHGVRLYVNDELIHLDTTGEVLSCRLASGRKLDADLVVVATGIEPDTRLAREASLELGKHGHIVVNGFMQTSDPDIYAAGDAVETTDRVFGGQTAVALGGPANRQGRVAADHVFLGEKARPYPGSLGTSIVRVFGVSAGFTGWTAARLSEAGRAGETVTVHDFHHATYFPGALPLALSVTWDPQTGVLLGAEAAGGAGVDKRLDVLSTAIVGKLTIDDLCHLELAYAPPFGAAKDIVNLAGFAACNRRDGLVKTVTTLPSDAEVQLIDVRASALAEADPVPGAVNIPMPSLRTRLDDIDRNRPVVTICALGKNSYFASRVLKQNGFDVSSVEGGLKTLRNRR